LPPLTQFRLIVFAAGLAICLAYLSGGARGIGFADREYVFSPAVDPKVQLGAPAVDVPIGAPTTLTSLGARGSLAVALGRRSAVRDFAAVSAAAAAVAFAAALHAAGHPAVVAVIAMLGIGFGETLWFRGTTYTGDALFPLLFLVAVWAALRWRVTLRKPLAWLSATCAALAVVDYARPMAGGIFQTPEVPGFLSSLVREFTSLGLFLAGIGLILLLLSRARLQAAIAAVIILGWHGLWRSSLDPVNVLIVIGGWWSIAVTLSWLHDRTSARSRQAIIGAIAILLIATPIATRLRLNALGRDLPSQQRVRLANDFRFDDAPQGAMVIAESRRADTALLLSARLGSRPVTMLPQSVADVAAAISRGNPIIAFANGGANLERYGFLFERTAVGNVEVATVAAHVPCRPLDDDAWEDVSLLIANGSLIVHGGPNAGPAGVVLRMASPGPVSVASVEPRNVSIELSDVSTDVEGVADLLTVAKRSQPISLSSLRIIGGERGPITVTFAARPEYAVATAEDPIATLLCPGIHRSGVRLASAATATASVPMNDNAPFGSGWHPGEADPDFFRWTAAPESSVRITATQPTPVRVTITATPASRPAQKPTIGLQVNECRLDTHAMQAGQGDYEWIVEERCWHPGVNQLWIATSPLISPASLFATHDTRLLGARIGAIRFARAP
jgi:hypothetical protein